MQALACNTCQKESHVRGEIIFMFRFAWPYVFLLLPLLWLVKMYMPASKKNDVMLRVPFLLRIQELNQDASSVVILPKRLKQFLSLGAWLLLIVACANPEWLGAPLPITRACHNIMLAIDVSPSMGIPDLQRNNRTMNRLQTIKIVAGPFIEKRYGDKFGLIVFGSKAYLQTPLTIDRKTIYSMLNDTTVGLAGESTAIGDAILLGVKKLSVENIKSRILILLTDGANNSGMVDPIEAAEVAKNNQIKIYTIGIGARKMMVSGFFGTRYVNPSADLDENLLKKISQMTHGQYFRAQDDKTLENILESINQLEPIDTQVDVIRPITALFYWPLAMALLLMLIFLFPNLNTKLPV
jgi:Ca-activated chloride channel family protein